MKIKIRVIAAYVFFTSFFMAAGESIDLTVVGGVKFAESLPRLSIGIIDTLKNDLTVNCIVDGSPDFTDVPTEVKNIVLKGIAEKSTQTIGNVSLFTGILWTIWGTASDLVPESKIKLAISMTECTAIPDRWVSILNSKFDAVIVPDAFYRKVYTNCGVNIPVFVLPCGLYLEGFLAKPLKKKVGKPFVFGSSAAFWARKNHLTLIEAFYREFGNSPVVKLKLHGRLGETFPEIKKKIKSLRLSNVELISKSLTADDYQKFIGSLDCYVLISKAEGYSMTPREALACGIPCILSDNTAHKTFREVKSVLLVKSEKKERSLHPGLGGYWGYEFNCEVSDVRAALRNMYRHYERYKYHVRDSREWTKKYTYQSLKKRYLTLIKPDNVMLGEENKITDDYIMTTSPTLFRKYKSLLHKDSAIKQANIV